MRIPRPAAAALSLALMTSLTPAATAQTRGDRARRAVELASDVARAAGVPVDRVLREIEGERAYSDELAEIDIDALVPFPEALGRWTGEDVYDRAVPHAGALRFRAERPVRQWVTYFTRGRGRATMETGLSRSGLYRPMAERIFREEGIPPELVWLAQVESLWKPWAVSSASAKGLWQFIPSTGKRYGLERSYWVDERADPIASTRAAARYLRFLREHFGGDWLLALAAYNSGEGRVKRAVARAGRADFWRIYERGLLPRETRNYVPAILAVITVARDPGRHGVRFVPAEPWRFDPVAVDSQTDLRVVADCCGISLADIWRYNPDLRRGLTPPGGASVRVPEGSRARFLRNYARVPSHARVRPGSPVDDV